MGVLSSLISLSINGKISTIPPAPLIHTTDGSCSTASSDRMRILLCKGALSLCSTSAVGWLGRRRGRIPRSLCQPHLSQPPRTSTGSLRVPHKSGIFGALLLKHWTVNKMLTTHIDCFTSLGLLLITVRAVIRSDLPDAGG